VGECVVTPPRQLLVGTAREERNARRSAAIRRSFQEMVKVIACVVR
jgi:hypothetical protein